MTSKNEETAAGNEKDNILSSYRHLNSCITFTSVKDGEAGTTKSSAESSGESTSEEEDEESNIPSALRGLSIGGIKGASLSALISQAKEKKEVPPSTLTSLAHLKGISIKGFNNVPAGLSVTKTSSLPTFKGVTIQSANSHDQFSASSEESEEEEPSNSLYDSLAAYRGISIAKVPLNNSSRGGRSSSGSSASSSPDRSASSSSQLPSALKSVSIKGVSQDYINSLLKKSKENKVEEKFPTSVSDWSKKGLSISYSRKEDSRSPQPENGSSYSSGNESDGRDSSDQEREEAEPSHDLTTGRRSTSQNQNERKSDKVVNSSILNCSNCKVSCPTREDLLIHIKNCGIFKSPVARKKTNRRNSEREQFARKRTAGKVSWPRCRRVKGPCLSCGIANFKSYLAFEEHHAAHVHSKSVTIRLRRLKHRASPKLDPKEHHRNSNSVDQPKGQPDSQGLKVTFKFTQKGGKGGKKKKTVQIVNSQQEMSGSVPEEGTDQQNLLEPQLTPIVDTQREASSPSAEQQNPPTATTESDQGGGATNNFQDFTSFDANDQGVNDRPPSAYQPQFESFTGDWFNEYESGSRIAAAMTGSSAEGGEGAGGGGPSQGNTNYNPSSAPDNPSQPPPFNKEPSPNDQGGLFSQAVLGGEAAHPGPSENNQGSFEQLCLNDSFGTGHPPENSMDATYNHQQQQQHHEGEQQQQQQQQFAPAATGTSDLLSELAYLNNQPALPMNPSSGSSPHDPNYTSPHSSNSGTPSSGLAGQPTPPPSDTSFRALATSPNASTSMQPPTSMPPNSASPLQQMTQMSQHDASAIAPRLTIANNLMPAASASGSNVVAPPSFDQQQQQQWPATQSSSASFPSTYAAATAAPSTDAATFGQSQVGQSSTSTFGSTFGPPPQGVAPYGQAAPMHSNNGGSRTYAPLPAGYRPSPPPRARGRPPLMMGMSGGAVRQGMIRGPGRPPGGGTILPLAGGRSSMRGSYVGGRGGSSMMGSGGQKRPLPPPMNQSPNKMGRKEDINVPSRQKDTECQIIAVANRNEGMPVIANVQGSSTGPAAGGGGAGTSTDSTIHLSDSITLSVRSNGTPAKEGGHAGVVANLLASRGITVTPAEKEREEQRRLPTASDLNLSSAISVHPPTSRDRDGFAVPNPPSPVKSSAPTVNAAMERPSRPPTVDLTTDLSATGGSRVQCSQCSRTFPTQSLLADHAKVHQQQNQSRMPFKCHLCSAGFSNQKGQQNHYQQFHQLHLSAGDLAIPVVDFRNPVNVQRMARLGITSFLPLSNLQNRGAGGVVGVPILTLENLRNGQVNMQQWGITDVLTLGPPKTLNPPRLRGGPLPPLRPPRP